VVERRRERETAFERHETVGGLEADDAAAGGWDPNRAPAVAAKRGVDQVCCERRRRAAAGAAGDPSRRKGIRDRAEVRVLGRDAVGELVQVRLADVRVPGLFEAPDGFRRPRRNVLGEDRRPVRRRQPRGVEEVLDGERDPLRRLLRTREEDPRTN
jgi:hypothetical protein